MKLRNILNELKDYGYVIKDGKPKCKVCNRILQQGKYKDNCCRSAYKQYLNDMEKESDLRTKIKKTE